MVSERTMVYISGPAPRCRNGCITNNKKQKARPKGANLKMKDCLQFQFILLSTNIYKIISPGRQFQCNPRKKI